MTDRPSASLRGGDVSTINLTHSWWIVALRGLLAITFGIVAFLWPDITMLSLVLLFAGYSLVDGALGIVLAIRGARRGERRWLLLLHGVLGIVAGIVAVVWPGLTVVAFVLIMAFWAVLAGILITASAFDVRVDHGRWWLGLAGLASIIYGVVLFVAPLLGAIVLTWWVGAHALVLGATLVVLAVKLRMRRGDAPQRVTPARAS
jgi:uncharacterized membrane protein HdeD (DUF308 family)